MMKRGDSKPLAVFPKQNASLSGEMPFTLSPLRRALCTTREQPKMRTINQDDYNEAYANAVIGNFICSLAVTFAGLVGILAFCL
jgi:hypothetical protein